MYYYKIRWYFYDDIQEYYLSHSEKKLKEEFNSDIQKLLCKYGEEYIKQEEGWIGANRWLEYIVGKMNELGYEQIIPHEMFKFSGGCILETKTERDDIAWGKIVGKKLLEKAIKKNIKSRKKIWGELMEKCKLAKIQK